MRDGDLATLSRPCNSLDEGRRYLVTGFRATAWAEATWRMETTEEKKALNEGTFREANEALDKGAGEILSDTRDDGLVPFLCECPDPACREIVLLTRGEYQEVRSISAGGLATLGHEDPSIERVVAQNDRFVMTQKVGRAGEIHEENSPRT